MAEFKGLVEFREQKNKCVKLYKVIVNNNKNTKNSASEERKHNQKTQNIYILLAFLVEINTKYVKLIN